MKRVFWIGLLFAGLIFSGCEKESTGSLDLNFTAYYGSKPMVIGEKYAYAGGAQLFFERAKFFISDVQLIAENGAVLYAKDAEIVNFTNVNIDSTAAKAGRKITIKNLPTGNYKSIIFKIGLSDALNSMKPTDFPNDHPLADSEPYWADWKSYIFVTLSGRANFDADNTFETGFVYHLGGDGVVKTKTFSKDFSISETTSAAANFKLDLEKVFINENGTLDIKTINQVHTQVDLMRTMSVDFEKALILTE